MKLVVTGALGHIGSRLIRELPRDFPGAEIVLIDNLATQRYASLFSLPPAGRYRFVEADVLRAELTPLLDGADAVVHLAAITDAASSFEIKDQVEEVNFGGLCRVAEACLVTGSSLLFASTTSVYGPQGDLVDEDCSPDELKPQSPYAEAKLRAERWLREEAGPRGLRHTSCRFGTIFGPSPGMRFHTAVNKFVWQACMGLPFTVWRTALGQQRPYLDLGDAVRAICFLIERRLFQGDVFNVVTLNATVLEIIDEIRARLPGSSVVYVDSPIMNQLSYRVSAAKLAQVGFFPGGSLRRGISETIDLLQNAGAPGSRPG